MQNERKENERKRNLSISSWTGGGGQVALTPPVTKTGFLVFIVFQVFESLSLNLCVESGVKVKLISIRVLCPYGLFKCQSFNQHTCEDSFEHLIC